MNRDEIKGKTEALKGQIKQQVGKAIDDPNMHDRGVDQEAAGRTQEAFGTGKRKVGEAVEKIGKAIKK